MIELKGIPGIGKTVKVEGDNVKIKLGMLNTAGRSREKTIPIKNIVSVQTKKAGIRQGYIYFQTIGGLDNTSEKSVDDIMNEENSVIFNSPKKYKIAQQIKNYIEEYQSKPLPETNIITNNISSADEIKKFKQLLDEGVISQEEFEAKKKQLIGI